VKEKEPTLKHVRKENVIHGPRGLNGQNAQFFAVVGPGTEPEAVLLMVAVQV
jgi:hypothetical protein